MMPWQNAVTVLAIGFAIATVFPLSPVNRIACSVIAFALILIVLSARLREHARTRPQKRQSLEDMETRIEQIRADRERRYGRRR